MPWWARDTYAAEVTAFVSSVAPKLSLATGLRTQPLSDIEFFQQTGTLKPQLIASRRWISRRST